MNINNNIELYNIYINIIKLFYIKIKMNFNIIIELLAIVINYILLIIIIKLIIQYNNKI